MLKSYGWVGGGPQDYCVSPSPLWALVWGDWGLRGWGLGLTLKSWGPPTPPTPPPTPKKVQKIRMVQNGPPYLSVKKNSVGQRE